jgi:hypothetical protein
LKFAHFAFSMASDIDRRIQMDMKLRRRKPTGFTVTAAFDPNPQYN